MHNIQAAALRKKGYFVYFMNELFYNLLYLIVALADLL